MNADGEHVLLEVDEGLLWNLTDLAEQLGQQKTLSTLLAYTGNADNSWILLVYHHHSVMF